MNQPVSLVARKLIHPKSTRFILTEGFAIGAAKNERKVGSDEFKSDY